MQQSLARSLLQRLGLALLRLVLAPILDWREHWLVRLQRERLKLVTVVSASRSCVCCRRAKLIPDDESDKDDW